MPRATDIKPDSYNQFLLKSGPGSGKTLAAATFALDGPVHISYFDKKKPVELITYFTEERFGDKAKKILNNIEYTVYGSHNAHEWLNRLISMVGNNSCRLFADITDSTTSLTAAAVNWCLTFSKSGKQISEIKDAIPSWDEYKVETSLITQALDLYQNLPCHVIWIAHPLPKLKLEQQGSRVTKVSTDNPIVTYGNKVAAIIPGRFTEIYHLSKENIWDVVAGKNVIRYTTYTDAIGDDYAKSAIFTGSDVKEFDITDRLFYEVWREQVDKVFKKEEQP